uniref:Uncharacterized protein n=1 Tax=Arundo donax TaxID=35708 RepID=A0A0A8ZRH8_ARUDO
MIYFLYGESRIRINLTKLLCLMFVNLPIL